MAVIIQQQTVNNDIKEGSPVIDDQYVVHKKISASLGQNLNFVMAKNVFTDHRSVSGFFSDSKTYQYYTFRKDFEYVFTERPPNSGFDSEAILRIQFDQDTLTYKSERTFYNIYDVMSNVGGSIETIFIFFAALIAIPQDFFYT